MSTKRRKKKRLKLRTGRIGMLLILIAAAGIGFSSILSLGATSHDQGLAYLQQQASLDLDGVNTRLAELREQQRKKDLVTGPVNLYGCFANSLILGDSRSEGFVSNGKMSDKVNLSVLSTDITNIPTFTETVKNRKPEIIYFCYGTNDIYRGIGNTSDGLWGEDFVNLYEGYIEDILEGSPNSQVAVNSLVPCSVKVGGGEQAYLETLDRVNSDLKAMCKDHGWVFIDNGPLFEQWGEKVFVDDGIHFVKGYFDSWAINMIISAYPELEKAQWVTA